MKITIGGRTFDVTLGADRVTVDGREHHVSVRWHYGVPIVSVDGLQFRVELPEERAAAMAVTVDYRPVEVVVEGAGAAARGRPARRAAASTAAAAAPAAGKGVVAATMTGQIVQVNVHPGDRVKAGDVLAILEAMKMQNEVCAPAAGIVKSVPVQAGTRVNPGDVIVVLEAAADTAA